MLPEVPSHTLENPTFVRLLCLPCLLQDADHYWQLSPPAQQGLQSVLEEEAGVAIRWA